MNDMSFIHKKMFLKCIVNFIKSDIYKFMNLIKNYQKKWKIERFMVYFGTSIR